MKSALTIAALPLLVLSACGPGNEIVVTNETNVILNDAQANYASVNEDEIPANEIVPANEVAPATGDSRE